MSDEELHRVESEQAPLLRQGKVAKISRSVLSREQRLQNLSEVEKENSVCSSTQSSPLSQHTTPRLPFVKQRGNSENELTFSRYKYYSKLAENHQHTDTLSIPDDIIHDSDLFVVGVTEHDEEGHTKVGGQNSVVTIFSIWNTMIGSSLLSMPWAFQQAGFALGVSLTFAMGVITCYSCILIIKLGAIHKFVKHDLDWSDITGSYVGKWAEHLNTVFSIITLTGGCIAYWILMPSFLFEGGNQIYYFAYNTMPKVGGDFEKLWNLKYCSLYILPIMFVLSSMKKMSFFAKFNSLGVMSVLYIVLYCIVCLCQAEYIHLKSSELVQPSFYKLTGVLMQSYFIHNSILSIVRNNRDQSKNVRDVSIAFFLSCLCYSIVGCCFWLSFPGDRRNMPANLLNYAPVNSYWALIGRGFVFFQMLTVFPLLSYIIRLQTVQLLDRTEFQYRYVILLNILICSVCVLFALFYNHVGDVLRFVGSFCGSIVIFGLPCLTWITYSRSTRGEGGGISVIDIVHFFLIALAFLNFGAQFIPSEAST